MFSRGRDRTNPEFGGANGGTSSGGNSGTTYTVVENSQSGSTTAKSLFSRARRRAAGAATSTGLVSKRRGSGTDTGENALSSGMSGPNDTSNTIQSNGGATLDLSANGPTSTHPTSSGNNVDNTVKSQQSKGVGGGLPFYSGTPSRKSSAASSNIGSNKRESLQSSQLSSFSIPEQNALSPFDACIEACDTIAAQYHSMTDEAPRHEDITTRGSGNNNSTNAPEPGLKLEEPESTAEKAVQIKDCSVRVSPDGFLIMNPVKRRTGSRKDHLQSETSSGKGSTSSNGASSPGGGSGSESRNRSSTTGQQLLDDYEDVGAGDLDLESSVVVGYDVEEGADRTANGFTARGWSRGATTHAICQTVDAMDMTEVFCDRISEAYVQGYKDQKEAARKLFDDIWETASSNPKTSFARSGGDSGSGGGGGAFGFSSGDGDSGAAINADYVSRDGTVKRAMRMGPLLQPGTTLNTALTAVEAYYSKTAQNEEARWRWDTKHTKGHSNYLGVMTSRKATATSVLSALREAKNRTRDRGYNRERALDDALKRADSAQVSLTEKKEIAKKQWSIYKDAQAQMYKKLEELETKRDAERAKRREKERLKREAAAAAAAAQQQQKPSLKSAAMHEEVWNMVQELASADATPDFSPTDPHYHPTQLNTINPITPASKQHVVPFPKASLDGSPMPEKNRAASPDNIDINDDVPPVDRTALEMEFGLYTKRIDAMTADDDVEDAAGALLNALSNVDNARRAARIAAETCLLSACKAQRKCLKGIVRLERESLKERLAAIEELEQQIDAVDVRADLDLYIDHDKRYPGGRTEGCDEDDNDDGGIASALAVLNCHASGAGVMAPRFVGSGASKNELNDSPSITGAGSGVLEGWGSEDEQGVIGCDEIENTLKKLFFDSSFTDALLMDMSEGPTGKIQHEFRDGIDFLVKAVQDKSVKATTHRTYLCYAMNAQRGVECEIPTQIQFQGLCETIQALLTGCTKSSSDIANAKMTMMLSQTFYVQDSSGAYSTNNDGKTDFVSSSDGYELDDPTRSNSHDAVSRSSQSPQSTPKCRSQRVYVKSTLMNHPLWDDDDFWDHALFQCVAEALTKSNVMHNLQRSACVVKMGSLDCLDDDIDERTLSNVKWHDFLPEQRLEAASQLHSVVFAQLGALSHSMLEFGCSFDRAVNFVRRLAVRHQLPISQRSMLLQHLLDRMQHRK